MLASRCWDRNPVDSKANPRALTLSHEEPKQENVCISNSMWFWDCLSFWPEGCNPFAHFSIYFSLFSTLFNLSIMFYWCRHNLLRHSRYISTIFIYSQLKLHSSNIDRSYKRKKKGYYWKKQDTDDNLHKLWQAQTTRMTSRFLEMHQFKLNPFSIAKNKLQVALTSKWTHQKKKQKQNTCVLNQNKPFSLWKINLWNL